MSGISVKMSSADRQKFRKQVKQYAKQVNLSTQQALDKVALDILTGSKRILDGNRTTDRGLLKNSITIQKTPLGGRRIGTNTGYGFYVEFGRQPGKMPPVRFIEGWVRRKLGLKGKESKGVAFMIAKGIAQRGTKAQPFLRPSFERERKRLVLEIRKHLARQK